MEEYMLPCLTKQLVGMDCPGCGAQRAFSLVLQGEFPAAFQMYPAIFPILILLIFVIINFFVNFKFAQFIKIALVIFSAIVIIVSYFNKMSPLFN